MAHTEPLHFRTWVYFQLQVNKENLLLWVVRYSSSETRDNRTIYKVQKNNLNQCDTPPPRDFKLSENFILCFINYVRWLHTISGYYLVSPWTQMSDQLIFVNCFSWNQVKILCINQFITWIQNSLVPLRDPYLMNLWDNGLSYTESNISLHAAYTKLHQKTAHLLTRLTAHNYDKIIYLHGT
jgi:hypothetical protein